jgi:hypothetical protein
MARNPAAQKAAKAIRRKAIVAAKRGVEATTNSPNGQIRQAARLPILECLVSDDLFVCGMGVVTLIRGASRADQHVACFMVDSFCLGVKDIFFRSMDRQASEHILEAMQLTDPASPIAPAEARKLLRDMVAWAGDNGFPPHADYARLELLFGDVAAAETDFTPRFGYDGKVLYVPGPMETPAEVRRRMRMVRSRLGDAVADQSLLAVASALDCDMDLTVDH